MSACGKRSLPFILPYSLHTCVFFLLVQGTVEVQENIYNSFCRRHNIMLRSHSACDDKLYFTIRVTQKKQNSLLLLFLHLQFPLCPHQLLSPSKPNFCFRVLLMLSFRRKARPWCWLSDFNRHWNEVNGNSSTSVSIMKHKAHVHFIWYQFICLFSVQFYWELVSAVLTLNLNGCEIS